METATFVKMVREMRTSQKAFYAAAAGSVERNRHFGDAKKWEGKVDRALPEMESGQPLLWPEQEEGERGYLP